MIQFMTQLDYATQLDIIMQLNLLICMWYQYRASSPRRHLSIHILLDKSPSVVLGKSLIVVWA